MNADLVTELLEKQSGVVARHQLVGPDEHLGDVQRRLRRREWVRLLPGVFVDHTGEPTWLQRAWAGVLAFGAVALALINDPFVVLWAVAIGLVVAVLASAVPRMRPRGPAAGGRGVG